MSFMLNTYYNLQNDWVCPCFFISKKLATLYSYSIILQKKVIYCKISSTILHSKQASVTQILCFFLLSDFSFEPKTVVELGHTLGILRTE